MNRALFLDRNEVINQDQEDYVKSWEEFRFIKGVRRALKEIRQDGVPVVVITNQSAIGRGSITESDLSVLHTRMLGAIKKAGGEILKIYYCPHHPAVHCLRRKPRIGMLKRAARELNLDLKKCLFVGDALKDIQAGKTSIWPDWVCDSLPEAVPLILDYLQKLARAFNIKRLDIEKRGRLRTVINNGIEKD